MQAKTALEGAALASSPFQTAAPQPRGRSFLQSVAVAAALLMIGAAVLAVVMRPKPRDTSLPPAIVLEAAVPKSFADWRELPAATVQVVNPQTKELLDKLYSQTLSRTYVNAQGYRIMLSLAYGDDQRGGLQAHMPEVCYPAQGFTLAGVTEHRITTPWGIIPARRVLTSLGPRNEPITYWFAMGDQAVRTTWEKRLVEIRLGLTGQVPDGLLFRISSIDADPEAAFRQHGSFATSLLAAMPESSRRRVAGI